MKAFPDLRRELMHAVIVGAIQDSQREDFRIVHYSVQSDHVHLIVEADLGALESGMRGFSTRTAKRLNRAASRKGKLWADRYHRHDLKTPREVRNALVYVFGNGVKHGAVALGEADPCSSARYFEGWATPLPGVAANDAVAAENPVRPARSWLLRTGRQNVWPGALLYTEVPKAARPHLSPPV